MRKSQLSKKIQEVIKTATPKQKAILVVMNYTDKKQLREEPLLTDEEVESVKDSLTPDEAREYNRWIGCYNVYAEIAPIIGLAIAQYKEQAQEVGGYLRIAESYSQEENHLNTIFSELKETGNKTALSALSTSLSHLRFKFAELKRDEEGYIEIDTTNLFTHIRQMIKQMGWAIMALKAFIVAIDEWTKSHKSKKLMPPVLVDALDDIRTDSAIDIPPTYSRKYLKEKIAKGYEPTIAEQEKAIFPCYEEMPLDENFLDIWRKRLVKIENSILR